MQKFLSQPFHVAEIFTSIPGEYVKKEDTIRSFQEMLAGDHDHLPEDAFLLVGSIEQAKAKAIKMAEEF